MNDDLQQKQVALSVVVAPVGGPVFLRRCLNGLAPQIEGHPVEVIVPYDTPRVPVADLQVEFPPVRFLAVDQVETVARPGTQAALLEVFDRLLAVGLGVAQGGIVALLQDTVVPDAKWCDQVLEAHRLPNEIITGCVEYTGTGALGWAVYFQDFGRYQLPLAEGPTDQATDINVSYKRPALEAIRPLWVDSYNEVTVNTALVRGGAVIWQRPQIVVYQDRGRLSLAQVVRERVEWGRLLGRLRCHGSSAGKRLVYLLRSPLVPLVLIGRLAQRTLRTGGHRAQFLRSLPCLLVTATAWAFGEFLGCLG
jgi:hypothetical protein